MKDSVEIFDSTPENSENFWAILRIRMATDPRRIITLSVLKEIFGQVPLIIFRRVILIYSKHYEDAIYELSVLSNEIRERYFKPEADVWMDLKNALMHMSQLERDRLRKECQAEIGKSK